MARSLSARDRRKQFLANNSVGRYGYGSTVQRVFITDLISEGPIEGLADGAQSVFFNDDSIFDAADTNYIGASGTNTLVNVNGDNKYRVLGKFTYNDRDQSAPDFLQLFYKNNLTVSLSATALAPANGQGIQLVMNWDYGSSSSEVLPTWVSFGQNDPEPRIPFSISSGPDGAGSFQLRLNGDGSRAYVGYFSSNPNNTTKSVNLVIQSVSSDFALATFTEGLHLLNWYTKLRISSISSKEVTTTIPTGFTIPEDSASQFIISKRWGGTLNQPSKYLDAGVQFNTGTINQKMHITPLGVGSNTTQLGVSQVRDLNRSDSGRITATVADNAAEIDKVRFEFRYPGGLIMHKTSDGRKFAAGAAYKIEVRFDTSEGNGNTYGDWITLDGNFELKDTQAVSDLNTGGTLVALGDKLFAHGGKFLSAVSFTHTVDLTDYQPYVGFQFRVRRVTNGADLTDGQDGRAHVWDLGTSDGRPRLGWRGTDVDKWQAVQSGGVNSVTGVITERVNYPLTSIATVSFNGSQFDNTPTRTYDAYGLKVKIPSNYTPREKKLPTLEEGFYDVDSLYEGIWDGTFQDEKVYTDNPAWVFYDILINNRYGVGQYVRPDDIDKWSLYKIARYCDELVPDGKGGFEPRFRANVYLAKATDVYKVLKDMATIFRGILYWGDGKLFPVVDDKKYPVYTFNRANVKDGAFNYESTAAKTRTNQMIVQWNNPDANYKLEPLIVEDRANIIETGKINQEEVTAFGCTSPGQAIRYGRWKLWTAINQTQIVEFTTAYNAAFLSPGDIINVQDNHDYNLQYSGRVKSATTNSLNVDRVIDQTASSGQVFVVIPESKVVLSQASASVNNTTVVAGEEVTQAHDEDGSLYTFSYTTSESAYAQINNAYDENGNLLSLQYNEATSVVGADILSVSANELTLPASSFTSAQANKMSDAIFGINDPLSSVASLKEYKIVNIVEESDNTYRITAVEYYESKFDAVDYNFTLAQDDPVAPLPQTSDTVPPPRNVNLRRDESTDRRSVELFLSWNAPRHNLPVSYSIEHNVEGYPNPLVTTGTAAVFENITRGGNYSFVLRAIDEQGRRSTEVVRRVYIEDDAVDGVEGTIFGLRKGGYADARAIVDPIGKVLKFEAGTTVFAPEGGASTERYEFTSASVNFAVLASDESAYILADTSSSTLKLIKHIEDTNLGVPYWYDRNITTSEDRWVTVSNSVAYISSTNYDAPYIIDTKAIPGEDYTEDFAYNSVVRYKTDQCTYAALATIITPGALYIDRELDQNRPANPITQTGALLQKDQLSPDIRNDFIIGEVDGSGNWKSYLVQDPDLQPAKAVNISLTPASLNYDASSAQTNTPSNFTAKVTALGFRDPEFRITLEGFSGTPATSFCSANGIENAYVYTFTTDDGAVAYGSGSAALITASVREVGNIAEEFSTTFEAVKIREGATGEDGRTVSISASNTVFTYNASGTSPSPASQNYEAIAFGTTGTPYFEFFVDGVSQGSPDQTSVFQYTPSASADQMPQTIQVKLYESDSAGAAIASDFTSAIGIRPGEEGVEGPPGTDAFTISIPNSTHTFTASSDGVVLSYSSSGTTIQVYQGTTLLTYSSAATSDAYTISTSAVNITVGTITGQGTGTVIVDDHSAFLDSSDQASIEYTITTSDITLTTEQTFSKSKTGTSIEGPPGNPGLLTATGIVYYQLSASADNPPSTPSATSYTFSTGQFSGLTSNWAKTPPNLDGSNGQYWLSEFNVTETTSEGDTGVPTFSASKSSTNFTNVVVFSDLDTDTSTVIHGGNISTGEIIISNTDLGSIRSGKANYSDDNNSGFFLGWDSNCAKFNIGNATQNLKWTGSSLQVAGELSGSVVRVKDTFIFEGTDVQGELKATTLAPGAVTVDSLSNAVLNLIDSRVGTSVGATFNGYYLRNATSSTYDGSSTSFIFQDGGTGGSASKLRGDDDPEAKLAISHYWTSQTFYDNLTGTAQFQYATSTSGPWTSAGSTINWSITRGNLDFTGETLYLYSLIVTSTEVLTGIPSGTFFWRVVFTSTGTGTSPLSISPAQFEASILEGVAGVTAAGSASTATSAVSASAWTIARDFTIGDTTIEIDGSSSATWSTSDIGITKANIDTLGISANFSKSANYAQSAGFATNANFSQSANFSRSANYAQSAGNAAQLGGVAAANYLQKTGGTMTGNITFSDDQEGIVWSRNTDGAGILFYNTGDGDTDSRLEYYTRDNGNEYHRWVHYTPGACAHELARLTYSNSAGNLTVTRDITANRNISGVDINASGTLSGSTLSVTANGTITGNLTITGDLDVNGTTTTIDSSSISVSAKTITVARNATGSAQADGAGLFVEGPDASILYQHSNSAFLVNHDLDVFTGEAGGTLRVGRSAGESLELDTVDTINKITAINDADENGAHQFILNRQFGGSGESYFKIQNGGTTEVSITGSNGRVGLGITDPNYDLDVSGTTNTSSLYRLQGRTAVNYSSPNMIIGSSTGGDGLQLRTGSSGVAMTILSSNNNVGIGLTNPSLKLVVDSGTTNHVAQFISTDNNAHISVKDDTTTVFISAENDVMSLGHNAGVNASNLNITPTGSVGIKTSSPGVTLSVSGDIATTHNAATISTRKIGARDTNGLAIATSNGTSHVDLLNSGVLRTNTGLYATGALYVSGIESTSAAILVEKGQRIASDDGNYVRTMLQHTTSNDIDVGQNATGLIRDINLYPGTSGKVNMYTKSGGTVAALIVDEAGTAGRQLIDSDDVAFYASADNVDFTALRIAQATAVGVSRSSSFGFSLDYIGSGSGNDNELKLRADNQQTAPQLDALTVKQDGTMTIHKALTLGSSLNASGTITGDKFVTGSNNVSTETDILITDNGNIGATADLNFIIDTDNNNADNKFTFRKNGPGTTSSEELVRITESGNVGIGTDNPLAKLDVRGTTWTYGSGDGTLVQRLGALSDNANSPLFSIYTDDDGTTRPLGGDALEFNTARWGSVFGQTRSSPAGGNVRSWKFLTVQDGDERGTDLIIYSQPDSQTSASGGTTATNGNVQISALSGRDSYINTTGNFMIGTSTSLDNTAKLHIAGKPGGYARITMSDVDGTNQKTFFTSSGGTTSITTQNNTNNGIFNINGWNGTDTTEFVRVDATGSMGIGTTSPAGNLHIKSKGDVGDATLILEADNDNNLETDNPRFELRQDGNNIAGYMYLEGNAGTTATSTQANSLVIEQKGDGASNGRIHFATGGKAPNQSGGPTNGTVRMTVSESGRIGVNNTAPTAYMDVRSPDGNLNSLRLGRGDNASYWDFNHAGNDLRIYNGDGNGSDILLGVNSGGTVLENKVGIGHATPDKALVVSASGATAEIVINDTTGTPTLRFRNAGSTIGSINASASDMTFINASRGLYFGPSQLRPFNADTGAIDIGSESARFNKLFLDNAINFGPHGSNPDQILMQYSRSVTNVTQVTLMQRHTELGATSFGGDDATIIGAGEGRQTVVSNLGSLAGEQLHLAAESGINFYTSPDNWSSGWAARNEMFFSTSGQLTVPSVDITGELASASISSGEIIATTALRSDLVTGATYPSQSYIDFDDDAMPVGSNGTSIRSVASMAFIIDSNNNDAGDTFTWLKDNTVASSATQLMDLDNDGNLTLIGQLNATTKSFLINHPTKEGMKLRYGSLEGPENGVYVRGRATTNVIELPDYWTGLVDETTITVQLTANGCFQKLFVDRIENNKVYLKNASWFSNKVDCYYNIYGERKDVEKLKVEY